MGGASLPDTHGPNARLLPRGCDTLGLQMSERQHTALESYLDLLERWNKAYNLTAIRGRDQMVVRHLLDSLSIAPYITGKRFIDVGTGAGLPGVPMAIMFPDREWHLLDSNGKKTRFLFQVKTALGLDNMVIHQARVESFQGTLTYDAVISRAFASLQDMVAGCQHLLNTAGCFLAMKGVYPAEELAMLPAQGASVKVHQLLVPGLDEARHLVQIHPQVVAL